MTQYDYKEARERLEKTLPDVSPVEQMKAQIEDMKALQSERKGVNDFLALLLSRLDGRIFISRGEIAQIAEEYAGLHPLAGEKKK